MTRELKLGDGVNTVVKIGNTVRRIPGPWTNSVHALLNHLEKRGFTFVPKVLGFDDKGREILSYIEGEVGTYTLTPAARSKNAIITAAKLLRSYHDATTDFVSEYKGNWQLQNHPPLEVICHGDYAPYNCVYEKDRVIGIIDFDMAHPGSRIWDAAYAIYRFAPITSPRNLEGFGAPQEQAERAKLFCSAYELHEREMIIPTMIDRITALIHFLYTQADNGNTAYQQFVSDGHDKLYLEDLKYINQESDFFTNYLLT